MCKKFKIWWEAHFLDCRHWRVIYPDGNRTYKLHYGEANSLRRCFGGKVVIDYTDNE